MFLLKAVFKQGSLIPTPSLLSVRDTLPSSTSVPLLHAYLLSCSSCLFHLLELFSYYPPVVKVDFLDGQGKEIPSEGADPYVGRCVDGWWVRVPLQVGDAKSYVLGKGQSRAVDYKRLSEEELKEALAL
jgi:hypothetical protein